MLEGAIIGAIVGLIGAVIALITSAKRRDAVLKQLATGDKQGARQALDQRLPAASKKLTLNDIVKQRERMAGLALVDDPAAIQAELDTLDGPLTAVTQVQTMGLIGLGLRGDAQAAAARLGEVADKMEQEGGKMMGLVKKKTRSAARLAEGLAGTTIPPEEWPGLIGHAKDSGMSQLVMWQALATALNKSGETSQATVFEEKVRQRTRAFEAA